MAFRYVKAKIEANKITKENAFIIDLLKLFLGLKIYGGLKPPKSPYHVECKRKDNRMDQNTLQCCYSHSMTVNQQI